MKTKIFKRLIWEIVFKNDYIHVDNTDSKFKKALKN